MWAGYARVSGGKDSGGHHHGDHETYLYVLSGGGRVDGGPGGADSAQLQPGDAALLPAQTIPREVTGTVELAEFADRVGRGPLVFPADGPE